MSLKALIVDDEPDLELLVRQAFRKKIRAGEYDFVFARNGAEALQIFQNDKEIGIVMADINMPVMDGLTLLARIGEARRVHRTVIVSAYDDLRNIRTAMNRGAYDFLTKPIDFLDFEATLLKAAQELTTLQQGQSAKDELAALRRELQIARGIQQSMLPANTLSPHNVSPEIGSVQVYASMLPAAEVGGDLYDYFMIDARHFGFAIGDVSGKGIPAALYMAVTCSLLRATAMQELNPEACVRYMNRVLIGRSQEDMYVTLFYGVIDTKTGEVSYCTAGHVAPMVLAPGARPRILNETRGMMLGLFEDASFGTSRFVLAPGETLLLSTDGITEAEDPHGNFLTQSGLLRLMTNSPSKPRDIVEHALGEVQKFVQGHPQTDDVTLMAVQLTQTSEDALNEFKAASTEG